MELTEQLTALRDRVIGMKENIKTEEATKNAFVMPFIQILGYDIFNPIEVVPEFVADISNKKGEKVDYCIQKDGQPIIIIECKHWSENLNLHNTQLERYFNCTQAKFGILTNGIQYRIYTDLDEKNKIDQKPFLEFDFENLKDSSLNELKKFHKKSFDVDQIIDSAGELKYLNEIKAIYERELQNPSEQFVRYFASKVYNGKLVAKVIQQFTKIVKLSLNQKINEIINERLKAALSKEKDQQTSNSRDKTEELPPDEIIVFEDEERGIYTTQEEINAFEVVVDILKDIIDRDRIAQRDTKSYMGVLLDDNNRQPICRFWFNRSVKYIGLFSEDKSEEKKQIEKVEHIYKYSERIIKTVEQYDKGK
jgi:predicted type IV restriction endonuclease